MPSSRTVLSRTLIIITLAALLSGCKLSEEKSYEYYAAHPIELMHDYHYCENHPAAGVCLNIVKKYFQYQKYAQFGAKNSMLSAKTATQAVPNKLSTMPKGAIFGHLDEPIDSL